MNTRTHFHTHFQTFSNRSSKFNEVIMFSNTIADRISLSLFLMYHFLLQLASSTYMELKFMQRHQVTLGISKEIQTAFNYSIQDSGGSRLGIWGFIPSQ